MGSSNTHFLFFAWLLAPDLWFLLGQTNIRCVFHYTVSSDRNIFCSLREGRTTAGSNVPGAFLVVSVSGSNQQMNQAFMVKPIAPPLQRQSAVVVGALDFRSKGQQFKAQSLPSCCFLRQELKSALSLSTQAYKMGNWQHTAGGNPAHLGQGGSNTLSCFTLQKPG